MSESITINGTTYNLSDMVGRNTLAADMASLDEAEPVVIEDAVVYRSGWNRNGFALKPGVLKKYAGTANATPILYEHDSTKLLGASRGMRSERSNEAVKKDDVLRQTMVLDDPLAKRILALGIAPRFSIHMQRSENTSIECSACGADMMGDTCPHWPGQRLEDGTAVQAWLTEPIHAETSVTFTPAVPGTGLSDLDDLALSIKASKIKQEPERVDLERVVLAKS